MLVGAVMLPGAIAVTNVSSENVITVIARSAILSLSKGPMTWQSVSKLERLTVPVGTLLAEEEDVVPLGRGLPRRTPRNDNRTHAAAVRSPAICRQPLWEAQLGSISKQAQYWPATSPIPSPADAISVEVQRRQTREGRRSSLPLCDTAPATQAGCGPLPAPRPLLP